VKSTAPCAPTLGTLPVQLRRSLTWDQGKDMARHREFSLATDIDVYFCDPHSPMATHHGNGDRMRTPTGCCASTFPRAPTCRHTPVGDLAAVAAELNTRPRKTLDWQTPAQCLDKLLAQAH
jgi:transposase, IS30 family